MSMKNPWGPREAEHLLNRAGFGAAPAEIAAAVARGKSATIDSLFRPFDPETQSVVPERASGRDGVRSRELRGDREARNRQRRIDRRQLIDYSAWWMDSMVSGEEPLRDRMTLFWHGYFTSSFRDVKSSYQMIQQNQMLREKGLGSFGELLFAVAKDPAMLEYLDNDENKKGSPNENFAREVMELFTLGEGHYTEVDIKEAARAFTGWRNRRGDFSSSRRRHDQGEKTVLGQTGKLDGDDVLDLLLKDKHCAPHVAARLLAYFEGREPSAARRAKYGRVLLKSSLGMEAFLRALFADPKFYRDEVVGQRIAGPVDYLVGIARRLKLTPPRIWMTLGSKLLGQELFNPPSVKGWDGGMAWMTTARLMQRGNLAGVLLGVVNVRDFAAEEEPSMDAAEPQQRRRTGQLKRLRSLERKWQPSLDLAGDLARERARSGEAIVDCLSAQLLAVGLPPETRSFLVAEFEQRRSSSPEAATGFHDRRGDEQLLRSFAHLILSLPEAQLN